MSTRLRLCSCTAARCLNLLLGGIWLEHAACGAEELPRYKLEVGQELIYRTPEPLEELVDEGKASYRTWVEWTVDVVCQEPDGNWWIVFREKTKAIYSRDGKDRTHEAITDGHFLLSAAGKLVDNATIKAMSDPTGLFPPLPTSPAELERGWESRLLLDDTRRALRPTGAAELADDRFWRFAERRHTALDPVYGYQTERSYSFDREAGLVRQLQTRYRQGWPAFKAEHEMVQTCELAEVKQLDARQLATLATQARSYFAAVDEVDRLKNQMTHDFAAAPAQVRQAVGVLEKAARSLTDPTLRALADHRIEQLRGATSYIVKEAAAFGPLLNRLSPDWQTTDLDGHQRSLSDYRGKVLVLDFWYRGCSWCMRAKPDMKQLVDDFAGQDVAIVGVNSDPNLDDARFVIDHLQLNYPTLKNGEGKNRLQAKYQSYSAPIFIVIDQQGVVRYIQTGYVPTLRKDLGEKIRELLAKPAG